MWAFFILKYSRRYSEVSESNPLGVTQKEPVAMPAFFIFMYSRRYSVVLESNLLGVYTGA